MNWTLPLLFILLSPGFLVSLGSKGKMPIITILIHALIFTILINVYEPVFEGFQTMKKAGDPPCGQPTCLNGAYLTCSDGGGSDHLSHVQLHRALHVINQHVLNKYVLNKYVLNKYVLNKYVRIRQHHQYVLNAPNNGLVRLCSSLFRKGPKNELFSKKLSKKLKSIIYFLEY